MNANIQQGVRTSTEPMSRRLIVYHLDLHCKVLKGIWYAKTLISNVRSLFGNNDANV